MNFLESKSVLWKLSIEFIIWIFSHFLSLKAQTLNNDLWSSNPKEHCSGKGKQCSIIITLKTFIWYIGLQSDWDRNIRQDFLMLPIEVGKRPNGVKCRFTELVCYTVRSWDFVISTKNMANWTIKLPLIWSVKIVEKSEFSEIQKSNCCNFLDSRRVRGCRWMRWKELALNLPEHQRRLKSIQNSWFNSNKREPKQKSNLPLFLLGWL